MTGTPAQLASDIDGFAAFGVKDLMLNFQRDSLERELVAMQSIPATSRRTSRECCSRGHARSYQERTPMARHTGYLVITWRNGRCSQGSLQFGPSGALPIPAERQTISAGSRQLGNASGIKFSHLS